MNVPATLRSTIRRCPGPGRHHLNFQTRANSAPLSPTHFLLQSEKFRGERVAVVYGDESLTYREFAHRVRGLAGALRNAEIGTGDRVGIMAPNIPPMLEAHYAIPMIGAVLVPLNPGLAAPAIGRQLQHASVRLLICDRACLKLGLEALASESIRVPIVVINDAGAGLPVDREHISYEEFIAGESIDLARAEVEDEFQPISVLYTSGTTGTPKGVVHSHRGAYLASLSNALCFDLRPESVHLWTWPMFHCNGLCFTWSVTAAGGTHVCMREVDAASIIQMIVRHRVTHFCAAPSILADLAASPEVKGTSLPNPVVCVTGGAAPPSAVLERMEEIGVRMTHQYGSTEGFGPLTILPREESWDELESEERSRLMARQGIPTPVVDDLMVADPESMRPVEQDGRSRGEIMVRGNTMMLGYLDDPEATENAMSGGWFRTGDIAVWESDGSIEVKDRLQDMIVSGSQAISSVEVEDFLQRHPGVLEVAVVAQPHRTLGHTCCAFVSPAPGATPTAEQLTAFCREGLGPDRVPRRFVFQQLPKTATGKIKKNELRALAERTAPVAG